MTKKSARNIFIFGTLFFFVVFLGFTFDTMKQMDHRAPAITKEVVDGKKVWHRYDCIGCHTILGNGSYFAPDLTKITDMRPASYLKKWFKNPKAVNPKAAMPNFKMSDEEIDNLIVFLQWTAKIDTNGWPPKPILAGASISSSRAGLTPGQKVYQENSCSLCHMISGIGGTTGPDLTSVAKRHPDKNWHIKHFKLPESVVSDSAMPDFSSLSDEELSVLADYMLTLTGE